jgi:hypothetical protein
MRPAPKAKKVLYKRLSIKSRKRTGDGRRKTGGRGRKRRVGGSRNGGKIKGKSGAWSLELVAWCSGIVSSFFVFPWFLTPRSNPLV